MSAIIRQRFKNTDFSRMPKAPLGRLGHAVHRHTGRERCSQGRANRRPWGAKRCAAPSRYCHFNFQVLKRSWRGTALRLVSYQPCSVRRRITQVGASSSRLNGWLHWVGPVLKMPKMSSIRPGGAIRRPFWRLTQFLRFARLGVDAAERVEHVFAGLPGPIGLLSFHGSRPRTQANQSYHLGCTAEPTAVFVRCPRSHTFQTLRPSFFQPEAHARPGTPK